MIRRILLAIFLLLLITGAIVGVKAVQIGALIAAGKEMTIPPQTVSTARVESVEWERVLRAVGSVAAVQGVMVSPELPGVVTKIAFESGAEVESGALLVQLDVASEQARLRAAEATAQLRGLERERARTLRATNAISVSESDIAEASYQQATAEVDDIRSAIAKKTITAPFRGRLGIRLVSLGQFVSAGEPIVSLQSKDPIHVDFSIPQNRIGEIAPGMGVRAGSDAFPGRTFAGKISAIDPDLSVVTRMVRARATVPNPDGALRPGMFARVEVILPESLKTLIIPATAVAHAPYGDSVFVVEDGAGGKRLRQQIVRTGETRGDFVAVAEGLKAGMEIVGSGVFRQRNGMAVEVDNRLAPVPQLAPRPAEG